MKVLIVYASAGIGHKKAAEAIYNAFKQEEKDSPVFLIDILDYTNYLLAHIYPSSYLFLIKYLPFVWGVLFYITDNRKFYHFFKPFRLFFEKINSRRFQRYLLQEQFDIIISTHFFSSCIVGSLKADKKIKSKLITVITDYRAHSFWFIKESDYFVVACDKTKEDLLKDSIPAKKIRILGIPIRLDFLVKKNPDLIRKKLQISPKEITLLIMGGGFGIGPYEYLLKKLSEFREKIQLLFVCGHNRKLYNQLSRASCELNTSFKIYEYIENVDELMQLSDIIITKAGGITLTESLVKQLPMLVIAPIPGQEELNTELMVNLGIMKRIQNKEEAFKFLKEVIKKPNILEKMRENIEKIAKPNAAQEVVKFARRIK